MYNDTLRFCRCSSYLLLLSFFSFSRRLGYPHQIFDLCEFLFWTPRFLLIFSSVICTGFFSHGLRASFLHKRERVDAPAQSFASQPATHAAAHNIFVTLGQSKYLHPSRSQALSTSFEKTCKSRLRGEFFQDVVSATCVSRLLHCSVPSVYRLFRKASRVSVAGARLGAVQHVNKRSPSFPSRSPQSKKYCKKKKSVCAFFFWQKWTYFVQKRPHPQHFCWHVTVLLQPGGPGLSIPSRPFG